MGGKAKPPKTPGKVQKMYWKDELRQPGNTSKIGKPLASEEEIQKTIKFLGIPAGTKQLERDEFKAYLRKAHDNLGDLAKAHESLVGRKPRLGRPKQSLRLRENRLKPYVVIKTTDKNGTKVVVRTRSVKAGRLRWEVKRSDYQPYAWETTKGEKIVLPPLTSGLKSTGSEETLPESNVSASWIWANIRGNRNQLRSRAGTNWERTRGYDYQSNVATFDTGLGNLTGRNKRSDCGLLPGKVRVDVRQVRAGSEGGKLAWTDQKLRTEVRVIQDDLEHPAEAISAPIWTYTTSEKYPEQDIDLASQLKLARQLQSAIPNQPNLFLDVLTKVKLFNRPALPDQTQDSEDEDAMET